MHLTVNSTTFFTELSHFSKETGEEYWEFSSPWGLMFQTNINRGNHLPINSFWHYDFNPFKEITLSIWEKIDSLISFHLFFFFWHEDENYNFCIFFIKSPENLDSSLKQDRKYYEKLISVYVPTLRGHNLVSWWISFLSHCIQYTSSVARVKMCKAKSDLVVFNSQIIQFFTIFLFHWLCGSFWSDSVDRATY